MHDVRLAAFADSAATVRRNGPKSEVDYEQGHLLAPIRRLMRMQTGRLSGIHGGLSGIHGGLLWRKILTKRATNPIEHCWGCLVQRRLAPYATA